MTSSLVHDRVDLAVSDVVRELSEEHEAAVDLGGDPAGLPAALEAGQVTEHHLEVLLPLPVHPLLLLHVQVVPGEHANWKIITDYENIHGISPSSYLAQEEVTLSSVIQVLPVY